MCEQRNCFALDHLPHLFACLGAGVPTIKRSGDMQASLRWGTKHRIHENRFHTHVDSAAQIQTLHHNHNTQQQGKHMSGKLSYLSINSRLSSLLADTSTKAKPSAPAKPKTATPSEDVSDQKKRWSLSTCFFSFCQVLCVPATSCPVETLNAFPAGCTILASLDSSAQDVHGSSFAGSFGGSCSEASTT